MIEPFLQSENIQKLHLALEQNDSILIEELWDSPKALAVALAQQATGKNILILSGSEREESRLYHDLQYFTQRPVIEFPAWETLPGEKIAPSPDVVGERYTVLKNLLQKKEPSIILGGWQACLQRLISPDHFSSLYLSLSLNDSIEFDLLILTLEEMGYLRTAVAADKGEFAVRGGIIDLFPVSSPTPYRLEFWGDQIDSIRTYDPIGQKSIEKATNISVTPAREMEFVNDASIGLSTLLDYLGENTLIVFDNLLALEDRYANLKKILEKPTRTFCSLDSFLEQCAPLQKMFWAHTAIDELSKLRYPEGRQGGYYAEKGPLQLLEFEIFQTSFQAFRWQSPFVPIVQYLLPETPEDVLPSNNELLSSLSQIAETDFTLDFLVENEAQEGHLQQMVDALETPLPKKISYHMGYLSSGFVLPGLYTILFPITELTHRHKVRRQKLRSTYHTPPSEAFELSPGDAIVHLNNGVGKFLGIEKKANHEGIEHEYFHIEYAKNAKLFVPINQAHLLNKYIGATEQVPELHTLGSTRWTRAKEKTQRAIMGYASELLNMYAEREMKGGRQYPEDSPDVSSFEEEFPFVETDDQLQAIANIKDDMRSKKAMDRLVCGDVGYGKTEVAMRAAFKAVIDGGVQVAVLVPTTVLAMQHYENFCERMQNFPLSVGVLSRFCSTKETKKTLEGVEKGTIDIVVGTHRLLSKDVKFHHLGLIIIDEEQRFGVKTKEHLKTLRSNVDCLTLSATPIPRTLYMSLVGARDLSVINTPPQDRVPIKSVISEPTDATIKQALLREFAREGQAFFIHNRVETIYGAADRLQKLVPQARIAVAHGQMHAKEIDQVFHAFKTGKVDLLVATTIVENGIDIPNANTILIDRAHHFGLAELYQLRGRVGRWNRRAYAYFLIPRFHLLPEIARKRLLALAEASGYGGGMKLAMRDLELRGAGDILGTEQSGHISAIGFHLYCKLLKRTIKTLQGSVPSIITDTKIEFPFDARLPEEYINESSLRMEIYQRLGEALSLEDVDLIWEELHDRFGPPPEQAEWLYRMTRLRVISSLKGYTLLKIQSVSLHSYQKKGKEEIKRQQLLGKIKTPEELEEKVTKLLG